MSLNQHQKNACLIDGCTAPVTFVVFGGTGDLAEKKIFPALFGLYRRGMIGKCNQEVVPSLPSHFENCPFAIVVIGRRPLGDEGMQDHVAAALTTHTPREWHAHIADFVARISYHQGSIEETATFTHLATKLATIDTLFGTCSHKIFHFSVAPQLYKPLLEHFEASGLNISCVDGPGMTRALLEKPIGIDAASAAEINTLLDRVFTEEQVFRIDHYLMKAAVWDMKPLSLFMTEHIGSHATPSSIKAILIRLWEKKNIDGRGAFYDRIGALRDVGQNHMLQMLTLFLGAKTPAARATSMKELSIAPEIALARGQTSDYARHAGIAPHSTTETYFAIGAYATVSGTRIPIVFSAGKTLGEARVEVGVRTVDGATYMQDVASLPHLGQSEPGERNPDRLHQPIDGYERAFRDVLCGNHERFVSY